MRSDSNCVTVKLALTTAGSSFHIALTFESSPTVSSMSTIFPRKSPTVEVPPRSAARAPATAVLWPNISPPPVDFGSHDEPPGRASHWIDLKSGCSRYTHAPGSQTALMKPSPTPNRCAVATAGCPTSHALLVDEVVLKQPLDQARAAVNLDLVAVFALQRRDVLGDVAGDQGGVVPLHPLERRLGVGTEQVVQAVDGGWRPMAACRRGWL